ncbi:MAG: tetratricopeptide repeat protein [Saprospiraceae bacterium]|nr:tetratricopeptide repeat protein [Saprospiraceae bacterium]
MNHIGLLKGGILFFALLFYNKAAAQTDFRALIEKADPVDRDLKIDLATKIQLHNEMLDSAKMNADSLRQLFGYLLLTYDYINKLDYEQATQNILRAESIARSSGDSGWLGWTMYRKGNLAVRMKEYDEALEHNLEGALLCEKAGDSLCLAENFEQVSVMYAMLDDFENAELYHQKAMPLLEKFGNEKQLATAFSNYGIICSMQSDPERGIKSLEKAIYLHEKLNNFKGAAKALNNLADAYRRQKKYQLSQLTYQKVLDVNFQHHLTENFISNYRGLYQLSKDRGDYESAMKYLDRYYQVRDSILNEETRQKIGELEVKYDSQEKQLQLEKSTNQLLETRRSLERSIFLIALLFVFALLGLWRWNQQNRLVKLELTRHQHNLKEMTQLLAAKNEQIVRLREMNTVEASESTLPIPDEDMIDFVDNLYDIRILTDSDWHAFKSNFEKAYPAYIQKLRESFPDLSDGEERLYLLIKLGMNSKEVASILGISSNGVKKSRSRLRKRLNLDEEINLEDFISHHFAKSRKSKSRNHFNND